MGKHHTSRDREIAAQVAVALKRRRREQGYTATSAAEACGIKKSIYGAYERAERVMSAKRFVHICRCLGINPAELLPDYVAPDADPDVVVPDPFRRAFRLSADQVVEAAQEFAAIS